jgi:hypothetical protein
MREPLWNRKAEKRLSWPGKMNRAAEGTVADICQGHRLTFSTVGWWLALADFLLHHTGLREP